MSTINNTRDNTPNGVFNKNDNKFLKDMTSLLSKVAHSPYIKIKINIAFKIIDLIDGYFHNLVTKRRWKNFLITTKCKIIEFRDTKKLTKRCSDFLEKNYEYYLCNAYTICNNICKKIIHKHHDYCWIHLKSYQKKINILNKFFCCDISNICLKYALNMHINKKSIISMT